MPRALGEGAITYYFNVLYLTASFVEQGWNSGPSGHEARVLSLNHCDREEKVMGGNIDIKIKCNHILTKNVNNIIDGFLQINDHFLPILHINNRICYLVLQGN
jgi:hypothetical protein